tara:strand:+ start:1773 stop:2156 length:384 start_codon:yes stop_codon:yes gene_type:complete
MSLQISYTDKMGATHSEAYAKVIEVKMNNIIGGATVLVEIWHNDAARSKSDANARKQVVISLPYVLKGSTYTTYLADSVVKADGVSVLSSVYAWLKQHNDGTSNRDSDNNILENHGNGINWTTATDV